MAPRDSSTRFHPYDTNKKPKIYRSNNNNNGNTKKTSSNDTAQKLDQTGLSINDLKRRIRDVKRLLNHADLSPEARIVQERALAGYEKDLKEEQERRQRSEMIKKYHFVRFLDRKAATKEFRTAQRRLEKIKEREGTSSNSAELAKLQTEIDIAQINVNYTIYYPLTEKYISLYPQDKKRQKQHSDDDEDDSNIENNTDDKTQDHSTDEKPPMWYIVQKCTSEKTLEQLRDGKLDTGSSIADQDVVKSNSGSSKDDKKEKKRKVKDTESKHRHHKKEPVEEEEGDSDGGFFEE